MPGRCHRGHGRGRKRLPRFIGLIPPYAFFGPTLPSPSMPPAIEVLLEEIEAMRLVDDIGLTHEEASLRMGVSKRAFWEDLKSGRRKIVRAIMEGRPIKILQPLHYLGQRRPSGKSPSVEE